ncbi:dephospho-CoA kinase [Capsulimonas corticalis]|uniref:Dephospho-CoA kinase n=1 Tax=Capsulimonas corticalis TaxID=2219043 RepID=A0A402CPD6_9BACT|nr:dephospho-CoA kinase [Capsulimonas corticalis]BDI33034.1 dephospho-CoA kinase [Capsulimonas corticalis]
MSILGITGGVATGKSAVTQFLAELGAPTISADAVARDVLRPGAAATQSVLAAFPDCRDMQSEVAAVDRALLRARIYDDPEARKMLESFTHPAIIQELREQIARWRDEKVLIAAAEIPLLFETGLEDLTDTIVVTSCSDETQVARLRARLGIDEGEARQHLAAQWPLSEKVARADVVIDTNGTLDDTRRQVAALWERFTAF